jgi:hypothetical protein
MNPLLLPAWTHQVLECCTQVMAEWQVWQQLVRTRWETANAFDPFAEESHHMLLQHDQGRLCMAISLIVQQMPELYAPNK